jgi:hypothetical protein
MSLSKLNTFSLNDMMAPMDFSKSNAMLPIPSKNMTSFEDVLMQSSNDRLEPIKNNNLKPEKEIHTYDDSNELDDINSDDSMIHPTHMIEDLEIVPGLNTPIDQSPLENEISSQNTIDIQNQLLMAQQNKPLPMDQMPQINDDLESIKQQIADINLQKINNQNNLTDDQNQTPQPDIEANFMFEFDNQPIIIKSILKPIDSRDIETQFELNDAMNTQMDDLASISELTNDASPDDSLFQDDTSSMGTFAEMFQEPDVVNSMINTMTSNMASSISTETNTTTDINNLSLNQKIFDQVSNQLKAPFNQGETHLSIALTPDDLGQVQINLDIDKEGFVSASFQVESQEALEALASYKNQIQTILQEAQLITDSTSLQFYMQPRDNSSSKNYDENQSSNSQINRDTQEIKSAQNQTNNVVYMHRTTPGTLDIIA